jgi:hypothetical protein
LLYVCYVKPYEGSDDEDAEQQRYTVSIVVSAVTLSPFSPKQWTERVLLTEHRKDVHHTGGWLGLDDSGRRLFVVLGGDYVLNLPGSVQVLDVASSSSSTTTTSVLLRHESNALRDATGCAVSSPVADAAAAATTMTLLMCALRDQNALASVTIDANATSAALQVVLQGSNLRPAACELEAVSSSGLMADFGCTYHSAGNLYDARSGR